MPTSGPTPAPNPAHAVLADFWHGIVATAEHSPWLVAFVGLVLVLGMVRSARIAMHSGPRDPVRLFSRYDKSVLLARAGHRCEHHGPFGGRCRVTDRLEADHVHPWSRGGSTDLRNGQILCSSHNRAKRADIPWNRSLHKLAERRAAYYPDGVDPVVVRRPPRDPTPAMRRVSRKPE